MRVKIEIILTDTTPEEALVSAGFSRKGLGYLYEGVFNKLIDEAVVSPGIKKDLYVIVEDNTKEET